MKNVRQFFWRIDFNQKMNKVFSNVQAWIVHYQGEFAEPPIDIRNLKKVNK